MLDGIGVALPLLGLAVVFFVLELSNIISAWRSRTRSADGLVSPCKKYVYRDKKWHPRMPGEK